MAQSAKKTQMRNKKGDGPVAPTGGEVEGAAPGGPASKVASGTEPDSENYVTFAIGGELLAFPMDRVREIIRMPEVVRVPLGPASLEGLANLRGRVLPIVSLRRSCGFADADHDDATRVIVIDVGMLLGFVVDRVAAVTTVERGEIDDASSIQATIDSDLLMGVIKSGAADRMVTILDVEKVVEAEFHTISECLAGSAGAAGAFLEAERADVEVDASETLELVSFIVDGQEYALPIDRVQEIAQAPETVTAVPNADHRVLGVMDLRGRLLPVVSLRRIFGLPEAGLEAHNRIVVVPLAGAGDGDDSIVGVVMDTVRQVLRVPKDVVDELPGFVASSGQSTEVESVCRLDDGKRLVSVLSADRMFSAGELRSAIEAEQGLGEVGEVPGAQEPGGEVTDGEVTDGEVTDGEVTDGEVTDGEVTDGEVTDGEVTDGEAGEASHSDEAQLVVFRVDGEEYGVVVDEVQEIIRVPDQLIRVPKAVDFVEGLVNLRGTVLPVIDLRSRLGLPRGERDERQRIVVLIINGARTGFIVDSVAEVLKLHGSVVEAAPKLSDAQAELISNVANLADHKRMLLILDTAHLLAGSQIAALAEACAA
jgi:purine-binding chemotaxis protein CheW